MTKKGYFSEKNSRNYKQNIQVDYFIHSSQKIKSVVAFKIQFFKIINERYMIWNVMLAENPGYQLNSHNIKWIKLL